MFKKLLLVVSLGFFSVFAAQAAPIPITALPFNITAPGDYVLISNLSESKSNPGGITISSTVAGKVTVDLKGFTISFVSNSPAISIVGPTNSFPIIIRNGTFQDCYIGIGTNVGLGSTTPLNNITISNINFTFSANATESIGIIFVNVGNSVVQNCTFTADSVFDGDGGINDGPTPGGNLYSNLTFTNIQGPFGVSEFGQSGTLTLNYCQFK